VSLIVYSEFEEFIYLMKFIFVNRDFNEIRCLKALTRQIFVKFLWI